MAYEQRRKRHADEREDCDARWRCELQGNCCVFLLIFILIVFACSRSVVTCVIQHPVRSPTDQRDITPVINTSPLCIPTWV